MIVFETRSPQTVKDVLCHEAIYPCIKDDSCPPADQFEPPMDARYIAGKVGDTIIGIMVYHNTEDGCKCHIQVLPEYRNDYAEEFARIALSFGEQALYCEIPECFPNVVTFAQKFGFETTQIIENGHALHGETYDVIQMRLNNVIR